MNWIHNASVGKVLVFMVVIPIEIVFGIGMYLILDASVVGALGKFDAEVVAMFSGALVALGGIWAFLFAEYAIADVKAYAKQHNESSLRAYCIYGIQIMFLAADGLALGYRAHLIAPEGRAWVIGLGVVFILLPPMLGQVTFPMANKPLSKVLSDTHQKVTNTVAEDLSALVVELDTLDQIRYLSGDTSVLRLHMENKKRNTVTDNTQNLLAGFTPALLTQEAVSIQQSKKVADITKLKTGPLKAVK